MFQHFQLGIGRTIEGGIDRFDYAVDLLD